MSERRPFQPEPTVRADAAALFEAKGMDLTEDFIAAAVAVCTSRKNILLTGKAGTGKTTFVKDCLIPLLNRYGVIYAPTATTGIAGSHFGGKTIHSWLGCQRGPDDLDESVSYERRLHILRYTADQILQRMPSSIRSGLENRIKGTEVILLDEVSMCSGNFLNFVDVYLRKIRDPNVPFGGIQMIFIGDFQQLPPVDKLNRRAPDWAFMAEAWRDGQVYPTYFEHVFRQADPEFTKFLNSLRDGVSPDGEVREYMTQFIKPDLTAEEMASMTVLVSTNAEADIINEQALKFFPEPEIVLPAVFEILDLHKVYSVESTKDALLKARIVREVLRIRRGMPVLLNFNDPEGEFVNGTKAEVVDWCADVVGGLEGSGTLLELKTAAGKTIRVSRKRHCAKADQDPNHTTTAANGDTVCRYPTMAQFPVIPASAITTHKCVAYDTLLPTMVGLMEIGELCEMKEMPAVAGLREFKAACDPYSGEEELGYRITTRRGFTEVCSERHPLLVITETGEDWVKAPLLKVGDTLRMRCNTKAEGDNSLPDGFEKRAAYHTEKDYKLPTTMTPELSWMLGALIGDGCVTDERDGRMDVTSMDPEVTERFRVAMWDVFGLQATTTPCYDSPAKVTYVHSKGVRDFVTHLGVPFNKAPAKKIPRAVFRGSLQNQAMFLQGLFDTDGGVNKAVHFTTASRQLAREVHVLLANLGIVGSLGQMTEAAWRVNVTGVDAVKFRNLVGFSIPRKSEACVVIAAQSDGCKTPKVNLGFYPDVLGKAIVSGLREELMARQSTQVMSRGRRREGTKRLELGKLSHWGRFFNRVTRGVASLADAHLARLGVDIPDYETLGDTFRKFVGGAMLGGFLDEIVSIERETATMRDICVPDGHAFVGNGFVNHNSQGMTLEEAAVDLRRSFAAGQVYVAVSRLRSPEGLTLLSRDMNVMSDPTASEYYRLIRQYKQQQREQQP